MLVSSSRFFNQYTVSKKCPSPELEIRISADIQQTSAGYSADKGMLSGRKQIIIPLSIYYLHGRHQCWTSTFHLFSLGFRPWLFHIKYHHQNYQNIEEIYLLKAKLHRGWVEPFWLPPRQPFPTHPRLYTLLHHPRLQL